jgi:hypothetical protein
VQNFIQKLSKSNPSFPNFIFDEIFHSISTRRHWYRKKRFAISICTLITLAIGGIIIGAILATRASPYKPRTIFQYSSQFQREQ